MGKRGIQARLVRVFLRQMILIGLATVLGVYAAYFIVENVLVEQALEGEAHHYWSLYDEYGGYPLPNTRNMQGFLQKSEDEISLPEGFGQVGPGFHRLSFRGGEPIVYVTERYGNKLYLVFKEEQVSRLSLFFGVLPLSVVLIVIYVLSWFGYRQSQRVISPVVKLSRAVESLDIHGDKVDFSQLDAVKKKADEDVLSLISALEKFTYRLQSFIERERNFTRDASHELRTPLSVLRASLDLLDVTEAVDKRQAVAKRMRMTLRDMEELIETLLMLAREEEWHASTEKLVINDLVANLVERERSVSQNDSVSISIEEQCLLEVNAQEKVLDIMLGNLIRNAFNYTAQGEIRVLVESHSVTVKDSGVGMDKKQLEQAFSPFYRASAERRGYGLGLAIVKRICNQFCWKIKAYSAPGKGTSISIIFPRRTTFAGSG